MYGGSFESPTHSIIEIDRTHSTKFNTYVTTHQVKLKGIHGKTYQQVCSNFTDIMRNVLYSVLEDASPNDMIRFHVWSSKFNGDDINTKFQPRSQIAPDYISAIIDKTMQSHNTIDMTDDFRLNVMRVRLPSVRGGHRMMDANMSLNLIYKRCAITGIQDWFTMDNQDPDIHCFAYALAVSLKLQSEPYYKVKRWSTSRNKVKTIVNQLHRKAGV